MKRQKKFLLSILLIVMISIVLFAVNAYATKNYTNTVFTTEDNTSYAEVIQYRELANVDNEAKSPTFDVILETSKEVLNPGDDFEVTVNIANIKNVEKGLIVMAGKMEYDANLFKLVSVTGENKWNFDVNSLNEENLKFVTENGQYITSDSVALKINMKVLESVDATKAIDTVFKLKELEASNAEYIVLAKDAEVALHIGKEDESLAKATIGYDISTRTNKDVTATISFDKSGIKIVDEQGKEIVNGNKYVFKRNGEYTFRYLDTDGKIRTKVAKVTWIDKEAPKGKITYSTTESTTKSVTATISFNEEGVVVDGGNTHVFEKNGSYTFNYVDDLGNKGSATATVTWIEEVVDPFKISSDIYKISDNMISHVLPNSNVTEFNKHITANRTTHVVNKAGKEQTGNDLVATGMKLTVEKENREYTIVVLGDINEDAKMDVKDLAKLKLHLIEKETLTGINLLAANVNKDEETNINDLALMKLVLIGLRDLK